MEPKASRATLPTDYGLPPDSEVLAWSFVDARLASSSHYWLASVGPGGAPHVRPIDGMWLDARLYFGGGPDTRWVRNIVANPSATVHLPDAQQAVILDGSVSKTKPDAELAARLAEESNTKYGYGQKAADYEGVEVMMFTPRVAFAWKELLKDATRFEF